MKAETRSAVVFIPLYAAIIAVVPAIVTIVVNALRDPDDDRCALAVQYIGAKSPNPDLSASGRFRLSSAQRALECVQ